MTATRPEPGTPAPAFSLDDQHGATVSLDDLRGRWVVLYFYPKDDTPGCTKEACSFRDTSQALQDAGAVVLGVSGDDAESHQQFAEKYSLPFQLLVDDGNEVAKAYGAYGTRKLYGRDITGTFRNTFVIDPEGRVAKVWARVSPETHGEEVAEWIRAQQTS